MRDLGFPRSTLSDILADLRESGYLHVVGRRWVAGPRLIALVHRGLSQRTGILAGVRPTLREIAAATGETAVYTIRAGDAIVSLEQAPSANPIRYVAELWEPYPLETTSPGMVFQAYDDPPPAHLASVRKCGYAFYNAGPDRPAAVAAPVHDPRGAIVGAIVVIGPLDRFADPERTIWPALRDGIHRLEAGGDAQPATH
jgi:DNA-binding IclR family transcriptional regulator